MAALQMGRKPSMREVERGGSTSLTCNVASMFDELKALADCHADLHSDRARLQAELERERAELVRAQRPWWQRLLGLKR